MKTQSQKELESVLSIGAKFDMLLSDYLNVDEFCNRLLDRMEGVRTYSKETLLVLEYRQKYLS